ncbi:hypothetical protein B0T17DRAFT_150185 [Bombardia bombarda]|uniref:Uncharacterized protein n=1 Tax=Bombardia bombarda TaxID=252184 RepID=A0AA39X7F8_9PEZI|nr:hypothetical protein B0T17DRAFT_150185 [Bombardia bombarda]
MTGAVGCSFHSFSRLASCKNGKGHSNGSRQGEGRSWIRVVEVVIRWPVFSSLGWLWLAGWKWATTLRGVHMPAASCGPAAPGSSPGNFVTWAFHFRRTTTLSSTHCHSRPSTISSLLPPLPLLSQSARSVNGHTGEVCRLLLGTASSSSVSTPSDDLFNDPLRPSISCPFFPTVSARQLAPPLRTSFSSKPSSRQPSVE